CRDRGRDLLLQTRLWRHTLHLARARSFQGLHLVRRGGPQSGAVRPPQTGIAASALPSGSSRQLSLTGATRNASPLLAAAIKTRKRSEAQHNRSAPGLATSLKTRLYGRALAGAATPLRCVPPDDRAIRPDCANIKTFGRFP